MPNSLCEFTTVVFCIREAKTAHFYQVSLVKRDEPDYDLSISRKAANLQYCSSLALYNLISCTRPTLNLLFHHGPCIYRMPPFASVHPNMGLLRKGPALTWSELLTPSV